MFHVEAFIPGYGCEINQYAGRKDSFNRIESYTIVANFNIPSIAKGLVRDYCIQEETENYAKTICKILNKELRGNNGKNSKAKKVKK